MNKDLRDTELYRHIESLCRMLRQPGNGRISDASEIHAAPDRRHAVFSGAIMSELEGVPATRICEVDLTSAAVRVLTFGPNTDRLPRYSPDGMQIAFLSDRHEAGDFQLRLLDRVSGAARDTPAVEGWVEYLHWSPDGKRILLGVAGHGADVGGGQGAVASKHRTPPLPSWMPVIESGHESYRWRRAWIYELGTNTVRPVPAEGINVWEAAWCGNDAIVAVVSPGPGEGRWYRARLHSFHIVSGKSRQLYAPADQLGLPAASPSGSHLAIVEAPCSDRWIVAGELRLIEMTSGKVNSVRTNGADISYTEWRSDTELLVAGHRGLDTVVGFHDLRSGTFRETWASREVTTGGRYVVLSGLGECGDCVLVGEGFDRSPEIAVIQGGQYRRIRSFDMGYAAHVRSHMGVQPVTWHAADGLDIQGWLLAPRRRGPHPLVMHIHGGPIWHFRPVWLARVNLPHLMLVSRGIAVFFPNPRGSTGRGAEFARRVLGDMGGADAQDCLSGLDHLVREGIADPARLGVTGGSYGGSMTSWLIAHDRRFAAAVSLAPVTNYVTQRLIANISEFTDIFLSDRYTNVDGAYFARSPLMHAHKVRTPTLNVCGALDRCTPPTEAVQFHRALLENGVESVLVAYPEEGHGIRCFPAVIDYAARLVTWFEERLLAPRSSRPS